MIRKLRLKSKLTQEALANRLGVAPSTVAMWERRKSNPRATMLPKLAKVLGCTIDELLTEE